MSKRGRVSGDANALVAAGATIHEKLSRNRFEAATAAARGLREGEGGALDVAGGRQVVEAYAEALRWASSLVSDVDAALGDDGASGRPSREVAVEDEVAAKVASHGLWILARVVGLFPPDEVDVEDIDDPNLRRFRLPRADVLLLPREPRELEATRRRLRPRAAAFAMYPETTSFYVATVAVEGAPRFTETGEEVCLVRFADDEDEAGVLPNRAIPIRFITSVPPAT